MTKDYRVLIPSKGRPKSLFRLFKACPSLNAPTTLLGLEEKEVPSYRFVLGALMEHVTTVLIDNPGGWTSVAREQLRLEAMLHHRARRYVVTDDNCKFTDASLKLLLLAQARGGTDCVMAGANPTFPHFHKEQIEATGQRDPEHGFITYDKVQMIYWCVPDGIYRKFAYPPNVYFDDIYLIFWAMSHGYVNFKVCLEALFDKKRHEPGGTGDGADRVRKVATSMLKLAEDFPQWCTGGLVNIRPEYKRMLDAIKAGKKGFS